jgi:hypothetical protein
MNVRFAAAIECPLVALCRSELPDIGADLEVAMEFKVRALRNQNGHR